MKVNFNPKFKSIAILFPGQGIQYVGLLNEFLNSSKQFIPNNKLNKLVDIYDRYIEEKNYLSKVINSLDYFDFDDKIKQTVSKLKFSDILLYNTNSISISNCTRDSNGNNKNDNDNRTNIDLNNLNVNDETLNKYKSVILNDSCISQLSINLFTKIRFNQYLSKLLKEHKDENLNVFMFGRSLGELNSLLTCNLLKLNNKSKILDEFEIELDENNFHNEIDIIFKRGEVVKNESEKGGMLNMIGDINKTILYLKSFFEMEQNKNKTSIVIAGIHSFKSIVLSGKIEDLKRLSEYMKSKKITTKMLNIPNAYHCDFMSKPKQEFVKYLINQSNLKQELKSSRSIGNFHFHFISSVDFNNVSNQILNKLLIETKDFNNNSEPDYKMNERVIDNLKKSDFIDDTGISANNDIEKRNKLEFNEQNDLIEIIGKGLTLPYNTTKIFHFLKSNNIETYCLSTNTIIDYSLYI